ncbi:accessory Sec system glycosylation chaperone GtfB [Streptococcus dentiloxodontae]
MINLFETYDQASWDLHYSLIVAGYNNPTISLTDDGFLPADVTSPYVYFTGFDKVNGLALFFNQVPIPDYWEISGNNNYGEIHRFNKKRGHIHYGNPTHKRLVKAVDWFDDSGRLRVTDRYNNKGYRFAQTVYNTKQEAVLTSYFNADNQEILVENHNTGDVTLNWKDKVHIFKGKHDFVVFYLKEAGFNLDRIFYNSLSTPFMTAYQLPRSGRDILFWQEAITDTVPENLQMLLSGAPRETKIVIQRYEAYQNLLKLISKQEARKVAFLGVMYPFARENQNGNEALILTNSDQIEQLESLVQEVPQVVYHIAALTEMSGKLMALGKYANVHLYPNVTTAQIKNLTARSDIYLDINYQNEILSAIRTAFENKMLILAFDTTVHNRQYIAPTNIFKVSDSNRLKTVLARAAKAPAFRKSLLQQQLEHAHVANKADYQRVIGH